MAVKQELVRGLLSKIVESPDIQSRDYIWVIEELKKRYSANKGNHSTDFSKEINGLSHCLDWGVVYDIQKCDSRTISNTEAKNLLRTLVRDYGQQEDLARWCIETWCFVLDKKVDLTETGVSNASSFPRLATAYVNSNNYSNEVFEDFVFETMKAKDLSVQDLLDVTNKGKQLGLTEDVIVATIEKARIRVDEEKSRKIEQVDKVEEISELHIQEEIVRHYNPSNDPTLIDNPDYRFVTRSNISKVIRIALLIFLLLLRLFLYFGLRF